MLSIAIHAVAAMILIGTRSRTWPEETLTVEYVSPEALQPSADQALAPPTETRDGLEMESPTRLAGALAIDLPRIRARREMLFPFLTLDLKFIGGLAEHAESAATRLENPYAAAASDPQHPPLTLADSELQRTVDEAWSRRHRWERFSRIVELVTTHAANSGQAAAGHSALSRPEHPAAVLRWVVA